MTQREYRLGPDERRQLVTMHCNELRRMAVAIFVKLSSKDAELADRADRALYAAEHLLRELAV